MKFKRSFPISLLISFSGINHRQKWFPKPYWASCVSTGYDLVARVLVVRVLVPRPDDGVESIIFSENPGVMDIESLQALCKKLPHVTEDIKWGNDLCFSIGGKMFCVAGLQTPSSVSFKVKDEEFDEMSSREGFEPAPYVARYKWVLVTDMNAMSKNQWEHYVRQSYELVKSRLPKKLLKELTE